MDNPSLADLQYIINNADYTQTLATALGSSERPKRKQVIQLLSALCVYNKEKGYRRVLETLDHFKTNQGARYRLAFIVEELRDCSIQTSDGFRSEYSATLLALVNCLLVSAPSLTERVAIRNQLLGLRLYDVLELIKLRREAGHFTNDMTVQLEAFEAQRYTDEGQINGPDGVDLNSHLEVFYAILRQVSLTPQQAPFLAILQNLLRVDYTLPIADVIWSTASKLVERVTSIEKPQDAERLLLRCRCGGSAGSGGDRSSLALGASPRGLSPQPPQSPAPLPSSTSPLPPKHTMVSPASPVATAVPPPPPPPPLAVGLNSGPAPPPPPPPPLANSPIARPGTATVLGAGGVRMPNAAAVAPAQLLPQQWTPKPRSKMKTLNWCKIPAGRVLAGGSGGDNLWARVAASHNGTNESLLDFEGMEELFCQQQSQPSTPQMQRRQRTSQRKAQEVTLLEGKRSLNISIFLKQFRFPTVQQESIASMIRKGMHQEIGAERLRGLLKILPEPEEIELLNNFDGDIAKLGPAEQFLLQLIHIPDYKLRIECQLLKEEFTATIGLLEPCIKSIRCAAHEIEDATKLHEILYMILVAGNFLNSGGYAGNAAGFRMMSLLKVTDMRANRPGMNLIHYVAMEAERKQLLDFGNQLTSLEEAARLSIDTLKSDADTLSTRVANVSNMVASAHTSDLQGQMNDFLLSAQQRIEDTKQQIEWLEQVRTKLGTFLCEDLDSFKLEECFKVFWNFCTKFRKAVEENEKRAEQERKAEARRRLREDQAKRLSVEFSGSESDVMDMLLGDIKSGFPQLFSKLRRNRRSDNNSEDDSVSLGLANSPRLMRRSHFGSSLASMADNESPDVTPTGSLRKRRNRSSSEFDDNADLLDYLKQAEQAQQQAGWHRRSSRRLKTENSENPNLETLHERPKHLDELHQQKQQLVHKKSKSPEPQPPTPTGVRGSTSAQTKHEAISNSHGTPSGSATAVAANISGLPEVHTERRASLTNVVRPMVPQQQQQSPLPSQQQQMTPVGTSALVGVVPDCAMPAVYSTSRPMSTLRSSQVEDTDTSTGGESPVLMRRKTYHSLKEPTGSNKTRHSTPVRSATDELAIGSPGGNMGQSHSLRSGRSSINGTSDERRSLRQLRAKHEGNGSRRSKKEDQPHKDSDSPTIRSVISSPIGVNSGVNKNDEEDDFDSESSFDRFSPVRKTTRRTSARSLMALPSKEKAGAEFTLGEKSSRSQEELLTKTKDKDDKSLRARLARKIHSITDNIKAVSERKSSDEDKEKSGVSLASTKANSIGCTRVSGIPVKRGIPILTGSTQRATPSPVLDSKIAKSAAVVNQPEARQRGKTAESLQIGTDPRFAASAAAAPPQATIIPTINSNVALTPSCALQGSASTLLPPDGTIPPSLPKTTATLLVGPQRTTFSLQPQRASFHGAGSSTSSLTNGSAVGSSLSGAQISHRHSVALGEQENRRPPAGSIRRTGIPTRSNNRVLSAIPKSTTNYLTSGAASPTRLTMNAETLQRTRSSLRSTVVPARAEDVKPFMRATSASIARVAPSKSSTILAPSIPAPTGPFARGPAAHQRRTIPGYR
ncbi:inverted formin-2-like isoform X1 [Varroa destructor]|uniref:FH2 domain-containing protein n=1 Tax=Varroa destructor TaxID=109461 RepID=A0A7M7J4Q9_VARDE|nr:inverted formin-2-like isoform X1 [Varroa destructor]